MKLKNIIKIGVIGSLSMCSINAFSSMVQNKVAARFVVTMNHINANVLSVSYTNNDNWNNNNYVEFNTNNGVKIGAEIGIGEESPYTILYFESDAGASMIINYKNKMCKLTVDEYSSSNINSSTSFEVKGVIHGFTDSPNIPYPARPYVIDFNQCTLFKKSDVTVTYPTPYTTQFNVSYNES